MDISYLVGEHGITVFIHIPMAEQEPMKLLRLIEAPILQENGLIATIDHGKRILALDTRHNSGIELHDIDLLKCTRVRSQYSCRNVNLHSTKIHHSCLGSIYLNHPDMKKRCRVIVSKLTEELVIQVGSNQLLLFLPDQTRVMQHCRHSRISVSTLQEGVHHLTVPQDCRTNTASFTFRPEVKLNTSSEDFIMIPVNPLITDIATE